MKVLDLLLFHFELTTWRRQPERLQVELVQPLRACGAWKIKDRGFYISQIDCEKKDTLVQGATVGPTTLPAREIRRARGRRCIWPVLPSSGWLDNQLTI